MKNEVKIEDVFWKKYRALVRKEMIPYQWKVLNDEISIHIERERNDDSIPNEKSHAMENFRIAAGIREGHHYGWVFQDSDVYKWLEAVAYSLAEVMDEHLKQLADSVVELISKAQEEDGYLGTYFTIEAPDRKLKRLGESHELYCAGHFMEAAAAYHEVTGNVLVLRTACRLADYIDRHFGEEEGKIHGCDGHEEVEIGLAKLYRVTGEKRYLALSRYFLRIRGVDPEFYARQYREDGGEPLIPGLDRCPANYNQTHKPLLEQDTAEGHAVRLVYMCTAMADVAALTGDQELLTACKKIWRNLVDRRMYITGGIGSTVIGESFTLDYDLPNDTMYCETCASVGLVFLAGRLLENEWRGEYGDVMERALYNTALAGMALDGKHFFYVNPLESVPLKGKKDPTKSHVKSVRPEWLGCACCPPNLARLLTSLEKYVYTEGAEGILVNLFMNCEAEFSVNGGTVSIRQETEYPKNGGITLSVDSGQTEISLGIRIPGWATNYELSLNGTPCHADQRDGIVLLKKVFHGDKIELKLKMSVERWKAHSSVSEDTGKVALTRGPFVYCMEEADNGANLHLLTIASDAEFAYHYEAELLGGVGVITCKGFRQEENAADESLYQRYEGTVRKSEKTLNFIPYYAWANRGENEMQVWIRQEE